MGEVENREGFVRFEFHIPSTTATSTPTLMPR